MTYERLREEEEEKEEKEEEEECPRVCRNKHWRGCQGAAPRMLGSVPAAPTVTMCSTVCNVMMPGVTHLAWGPRICAIT